MPLPDSLVYKENQYERTGRIVLGSDELFREASWFAVMNGQGLEPRDYNPLIDSYSDDQNTAHLAQIHRAVAEAAARAPAHDEYLRQRAKAGLQPA
jgi:tryptophan halogenase